MTKPRITAAAVVAAHDFFDRYVLPDQYYTVSSEEQRRIRMEAVRQGLIAAHLADLQNESAV